MTRKAAKQCGLQQENGLTKRPRRSTGLATNLNADLNELAGRVNLIAWPYTLPEVVPDVQATWESFCESRAAIHGGGPSMAAARVAVIDSPGHSCEAES